MRIIAARPRARRGELWSLVGIVEGDMAVGVCWMIWFWLCFFAVDLI